MEPRTIIGLVDDDVAFLFSLSQRLQDQGFAVRSYRDGSSLLSDLDRGVQIDCICADVRMPGLSGLDIQQRLSERASTMPMIMFTGYADMEIAVSAIKAGARDFVGKPINESRLVESIQAAVAESRRRANEMRDFEQVALRVSELSERHRQVLDLMVKGLTSKQIASVMKINHRTVENYRAFVMERVGVGNVAQLVRVMMQLESNRRAQQRSGGEG